MRPLRPAGPLYAAVALFVVGLVIAGFATTMPMLVVGRLVQGLGTGGQTVALYVVVARVYPPRLHGRVFAAFSAAWVVPSLVGPFLAGAVTEYLHWRWVFLGVAVLTVIAFTMVAVRLRGRRLAHRRAARRAVVIGRCSRARSRWPSVASGSQPRGRARGVGGGSSVAASVLVIALRGAGRCCRVARFGAARGLPSVVLMRGLIAGALFGAEIYVPYLLIADYGFSPTWAGLGLTAAALLWAAAAHVQGRFGDRLGNTRITLISSSLLFPALAVAASDRLGSPASRGPGRRDGRSAGAGWGSCIRGSRC